MNIKGMGAYLAQLRKEHGMTQEQLGEKLGVSNKTVSRWETGTYLPPVDILEKLSGLYGVTINELLSGRSLPAEEYQAAAEENIKSALNSAFSQPEQREYYKKKWLREHLFELIGGAAIILMILFFGIKFEKNLFTWGALIGGVLFPLYQKNQMMIYIESHLYDNTEK